MSSLYSTFPASLLAHARRQLDIPAMAPDTTVPMTFLVELDKHMSIYPHDTNFRLKAQPKEGYGLLVCLEEGCHFQKIRLTTRNTGKEDGGKKDGIGSLSAYRYHIKDHPTHIHHRQRRVEGKKIKKEPVEPTIPAVTTPTRTNVPMRMPSLINALDATFGSPSMVPSSSPHKLAFSPTQQHCHIMQRPRASLPTRMPGSWDPSFAPSSPSASIVPKKRTSDFGPAREVIEIEDDSDFEDDEILAMFKGKGPARINTTPLSKKVKIEPKEPFTPVENKPTFFSPYHSSAALITTRAPLSMPIPEISYNIATIGLDEVNHEISSNDYLYDLRLKKLRKTQADKLYIAKHAESKAELLKKKGEYENTIMYWQAHAAALPAHLSPVKLLVSPHVRTQLAGTQPSNNSLSPHFSPVPQLTSSPGGTHDDLSAYFAPLNPVKKLEIGPWDPSFQPIASGSNIQLSNLPAVKKMDFDSDPMFNVMDTLSKVEDLPSLYAHPLGGALAYPGYNDYDANDRYDADDNWFGRGRDTFAGPKAQHGDLDQFFMEAGNSEQFDSNASVMDALCKLGLPDLSTPLPGMQITLMPHQAIGVAWMLEKERGVNKGGCLCDEMGLGKTVQMIAAIMCNPSEDPACKTTLIIAPVALLNQWQLEIELKTNDALKCLVYHGSGKTKKKRDLMKYDVVLTTFQTLALEWPDEDAEEKARKKRERAQKKGEEFIISDSEDENGKRKKKKSQESGPLITMQWYRIVIDEAQNIRNKKTRISRGVTRAKATYRWCLTGTPITNGLGDAYGLLRFLMIRPWYDWEAFHSHITKVERKSPTLATHRLQAIFAACLLRRKKDTMLDGKRLIELPAKEVELCKLEFTQDERDVYSMVETRSQQIFNRYLRAGTVLKNYAHVLVMLLRLRQICSHTSLITESDGVIADEDYDETKESIQAQLIRAENYVSSDFVTKMKSKFKDLAVQRMQAEKESQDAVIEGEECPICYDNYTNPVVTACAHIFCHECIGHVLNSPFTQDAAEPNRYKSQERPCPSCRAPISKDKIFARAIFEPSDEELQPYGHIVKTEQSDDEMPDILGLQEGADKGKGKAAINLKTTRKKRSTRIILDSDDICAPEDAEEDDDDDDLSDFIVYSDEDEEGKDVRRVSKKRMGERRSDNTEPEGEEAEEDNAMDMDVVFGPGRSRASLAGSQIRTLSKLLPSTKMKNMMDTLLEWAKEHPGEKTLIISQWTQCLQLVSDYLNTKDFYHVKYQGDMNRDKRDAAILQFKKNDKVQVMLMSLKCGGVGLNLTCANRVISLDLGWSEAVESQAFDRVHRLGQTKPVKVKRLVINNTVEDRVLALQEKKKNLADGSLGEGNGKKIGRMTVSELAGLFGLDPRGHPLERH